jgi:hypothetical protein
VERAQVEHRAARAEAACAEAAGRLRATIVEVAEAREELQVGRCGGWGLGRGLGKGVCRPFRAARVPFDLRGADRRRTSIALHRSRHACWGTLQHTRDALLHAILSRAHWWPTSVMDCFCRPSLEPPSPAPIGRPQHTPSPNPPHAPTHPLLKTCQHSFAPHARRMQRK